MGFSSDALCTIQKHNLEHRILIYKGLHNLEAIVAVEVTMTVPAIASVVKIRPSVSV